MASVFDWKAGGESMFARDRKVSRLTKDGKTIGQVASESIAKRTAEGKAPGFIPGLGDSERRYESVPPRVGTRGRE